LLLDEGFGPRVAEELLGRYAFPPNVTIMDRGVMGMAILSDLKSADEVLIIDALDKTGNPPGTIMQFSPEDLVDYQVFHGAHDVRIIDVLNAASLIGINPQVTCLGVQIKDMWPATFEIGLTEELDNALSLMVALVISWLSERGVEVSRV